MESIKYSTTEREVNAVYFDEYGQTALKSSDEFILIYFIQNNGTYGIPYVAVVDRKTGLIARAVSLHGIYHELEFSDDLETFKKYMEYVK